MMMVKQHKSQCFIACAVIYIGLGNDSWQFTIAFPRSLGHVISFSRKEVICLTNWKRASNGCSKIQMPPQKKATGQL